MANACVKSSRLVRGGIGGVAGGLLGAGIGYGIFALAAGKWFSSAAAAPSAGTVADMPFWAVALIPLLGVAGAGTGAYIGARKPQCE
jgi:hypothetical protein